MASRGSRISTPNAKVRQKPGVAIPDHYVHNVHIMRSTSVNVAELRNRLSTYLGKVRGGEEILICDRKLPIAKIVPLSKTENFDEELLEMAAQGLVRLPEEELDLKSFFALPAPNIPQAKLRAAFEAEREED
jgi:prevent-host-death family protein